jgi:hypothetical protein
MEHFDPLLDEKPISFEEMTAIVAPKFNHSVLLTNPHHWDIGSLMTWEKIEPGYDVPPDMISFDNGLMTGRRTVCVNVRFQNQSLAMATRN